MSGRDVLVLSKWNGGGVRFAARAVRDQGFRPVLVSALPEDLNRDSCDGHVVLDWDRADEEAGLAELERLLAAAAVEPVAVVNMVEALIPWQIRIAERYGLPGAEPGRRVLLSKLSLRRTMAAAGLSRLGHAGGPAAGIDPDAVDFYPAVVKPSRESGASRLVRRVGGPAELRDHLAEIGRQLGPDVEVVVEEFIDGVEFSVDGPVVAGRFTGALVVEKPDHDGALLHDAGLLVSPPQDPRVAAGAEHLIALVDRVCAELALDHGWLHVEGRARADGTAELIEINPRPGGGTYRSAVRHATGTDPVAALVRMALPGGWVPPAAEAGRSAEARLLFGMLPVEARAVGRVVAETTGADLTALPGVLDGYVLDGYRVESLDGENFFSMTLFTADDLPALRAISDRVRSTLRFRVESD
ncbi:ATP-grasp domain-containing protein [Kitasatospora cineracea]|uniref:ATP-grasp domain-containing protein n=1 Tax=Kitasatospora cineracea TaxID=88074 RepID=UPI0034408221